MEDWVDIEEDTPQLSKGCNIISIDVDLLLADGTIIENCFYNYKRDMYYNSDKQLVRNVKAWRTHED